MEKRQESRETVGTRMEVTPTRIRTERLSTKQPVAPGEKTEFPGAMTCPQCQGTMTFTNVQGEFHAHRCNRCHGVFMTYEESTRLFEHSMPMAS